MQQDPAFCFWKGRGLKLEVNECGPVHHFNYKTDERVSACCLSDFPAGGNDENVERQTLSSYRSLHLRRSNLLTQLTQPSTSSHDVAQGASAQTVQKF